MRLKNTGVKVASAVMIGAMLFGSDARADVTCAGKLDYVSIASPDSGYVVINLDFNGNDIGVCYLNGSGYMSAQACRGIYAMLLSARLAARTVSIHFPTYDDCDDPIGLRDADIGSISVL